MSLSCHSAVAPEGELVGVGAGPGAVGEECGVGAGLAVALVVVDGVPDTVEAGLGVQAATARTHIAAAAANRLVRVCVIDFPRAVPRRASGCR
jgi:hypothetical protein